MYLPMDLLLQNVGLGRGVGLSSLQRLGKPGLRTGSMGSNQSVPNTGLGRYEGVRKRSECFYTLCV